MYSTLSKSRCNPTYNLLIAIRCAKLNECVFKSTFLLLSAHCSACSHLFVRRNTGRDLKTPNQQSVNTGVNKNLQQTSPLTGIIQNKEHNI